MIKGLLSVHGKPALVLLAISVFARCCATKDPWEACEKKEKLQETDATKGIHDFDVCQLRPAIDVPESERPGRLCTAHLALVEGHGQVIVPATCFLPDAADQNSLYLQKQDKGWAFQGKLSLTCGPHMYSSTFADPKVLLHPEFVPEKKFAQLHNFAVVRISREDYGRAREESTAWEFARLSEAAKKQSTGAKCRCYAGTIGAPGSAEPPEYQVERCQFPSNAPADVKQQTCFLLKESETSAKEFGEIASLSACGQKFCGLKQTMSCFCGSSADELRTLHSIGSYFWKKPKGEVRFYSIPLKDNWEFLRASVHESTPIGATDVQMENVRKHLGKLVDHCFAGNNGAATKSFMKKYLCETAEETASNADNTQTFKTQLKELNDCMNKQAETALSAAAPPEVKGRELLIPPFEQAIGLAYRMADEKICTKSNIIDAVKRFRKRLSRKMRCFGLHFSAGYSMKRHPHLDFVEMFNDAEVMSASGILAGFAPAAVGTIIIIGCDAIGKERNPAFYWPCMVIAGIFWSPGLILDGLLVGAVVGTDAAISAVHAVKPAYQATKKGDKRE